MYNPTPWPKLTRHHHPYIIIVVPQLHQLSLQHNHHSTCCLRSSTSWTCVSSTDTCSWSTWWCTTRHREQTHSLYHISSLSCHTVKHNYISLRHHHSSIITMLSSLCHTVKHNYQSDIILSLYLLFVFVHIGRLLNLCVFRGHLLLVDLVMCNATQFSPNLPLIQYHHTTIITQTCMIQRDHFVIVFLLPYFCARPRRMSCEVVFSLRTRLLDRWPGPCTHHDRAPSVLEFLRSLVLGILNAWSWRRHCPSTRLSCGKLSEVHVCCICGITISWHYNKINMNMLPNFPRHWKLISFF